MTQPTSPFDRYPTITPYLYYPDPAKAIEWLARAFGFRERGRIVDDAGTITHAEVAVGTSGVVMFGSAAPEYGPPGEASRVHGSLYVAVADVDALFERAVTAGAGRLVAPVDQPWGDRECAVTDLVGHHWYFWSRLAGPIDLL
jgi:uncharacterized glyoxalase superfamily protein PhnB